jgi:hypothetical protein
MPSKKGTLIFKIKTRAAINITESIVECQISDLKKQPEKCSQSTEERVNNNSQLGRK